VALSLLLASAPARADESLGERASGPWPIEKKVVVITLGAVTAGALAYTLYSHVELQSAKDAHDSDYPRTSSGVVDCATAAQCQALRGVERDMDAWGDRVVISGAVVVGAAFATAATMLLWPNGRARVSAGATPGGASVGVGGSF